MKWPWTLRAQNNLGQVLRGVILVTCPVTRCADKRCLLHVFLEKDFFAAKRICNQLTAELWIPRPNERRQFGGSEGSAVCLELSVIKPLPRLER
ncbi:hypothetical protein X801_06897 [Opisthorchis viverrini]|uniref:Uncharacterized protein n=1 Tax=Opisthorchis viverrini TaxID=6198 RepID=A0A1S8WS60_OPIVI|nr:hypothetical protein X801_06897 [Opisthorchis viverrini]